VQTLLLHLQSIHGVDTQQLEPTSNFPNYLPSLILSQPATFSKALISRKFHHRIASSRKYMQTATARHHTAWTQNHSLNTHRCTRR
jgi:hypothetical protein